MQHLYAHQPYGHAPVYFHNHLNRAAMYHQPRFMPEMMMLDLQQDLAEELGMEPDLELMQLDEINPLLEATDADMEELDDEDLEDLMSKQGQKIKDIFKGVNSTLGKISGDTKCFYKIKDSGSIYATSAEDSDNK